MKKDNTRNQKQIIVYICSMYVVCSLPAPGNQNTYIAIQYQYQYQALTILPILPYYIEYIPFIEHQVLRKLFSGFDIVDQEEVVRLVAGEESLSSSDAEDSDCGETASWEGLDGALYVILVSSNIKWPTLYFYDAFER